MFVCAVAANKPPLSRNSILFGKGSCPMSAIAIRLPESGPSAFLPIPAIPLTLELSEVFELSPEQQPPSNRGGQGNQPNGERCPEVIAVLIEQNICHRPSPSSGKNHHPPSHDGPSCYYCGSQELARARSVVTHSASLTSGCQLTSFFSRKPPVRFPSHLGRSAYAYLRTLAAAVSALRRDLAEVLILRQ